MAVFYNNKDNLPEIDYKVGNGSSSVSYKTKNGLVLKKYLFNEVYKKILEFHDYNFLKYLIELSKMKNDILVVPKDIYVRENGIVKAQVYPYQPGTTIDEMYPKTNLDNLLNALVEFYNILEGIDYLKLKDMHSKNIIYTGKIKLMDLDFSTFTEDKHVVRENIIHINNYLIRGIFDLDLFGNIIVDSSLKELLDSTLNGELTSVDFLKKYKDMIIEKYGVCNYVKHLSKDFIGII